MPYLILGIGLLIGFYGLYRFFLNADAKEVKAFSLTLLAVVFGLALLFLALSGRLVLALVLLLVLTPFAAKFFRGKKEGKTSSAMTRREALEVLGLPEDASEEDISAAYKKLMQKVHPDSEGSDWMAAKLNQARDVLLGR